MSHIIADKAQALVTPLAQGMGLEVVDVDFVREGAEWFLRVYIDKRGGVRIDDCEQLSKIFSTVLDGEDIINRAYNLVVSSPGLDRPLKTEADFRRYEGDLLDIQMLPGRLKTSLREEPQEKPPERPPQEKPPERLPERTPKGAAGKPLTESGKNIRGTAKKAGHRTGGADMISGFLDRYEGGRIYITDERGDAFSLAWEDVKTVKRAIRFK